MACGSFNPYRGGLEVSRHRKSARCRSSSVARALCFASSRASGAFVVIAGKCRQGARSPSCGTPRQFGTSPRQFARGAAGRRFHTSVNLGTGNSFVSSVIAALPMFTSALRVSSSTSPSSAVSASSASLNRALQAITRAVGGDWIRCNARENRARVESWSGQRPVPRPCAAVPAYCAVVVVWWHSAVLNFWGFSARARENLAVAGMRLSQTVFAGTQTPSPWGTTPNGVAGRSFLLLSIHNFAEGSHPTKPLCER